MGTQLPLAQRGTGPQLSAYICCGQMTGWIKMPLDREVGIGPSELHYRWGTSSPSPKMGHSPQFSAHFYCGQTAGCNQDATFGMEVGIDPGHIVLDGDPVPLFLAHMSIVAKRLDGSRCHLVWG